MDLKCTYTIFQRLMQLKVEIYKIRATIYKKRSISDPIIKEYKFTAYSDRKETSL